MKHKEIAEMRKGQVIRDESGELGNELDNVSPVYQLTSLSYTFIGSVLVSCTHSKVMDDIE